VDVASGIGGTVSVAGIAFSVAEGTDVGCVLGVGMALSQAVMKAAATANKMKWRKHFGIRD
jgi:hypothetical protein